MKKLKKIFGWLTVLLAVLMVACFLVGPIMTCIEAGTPDQIVSSVLEVVMPDAKFGGPLFDFATIFAFDPIVQSILGILGLFLLACVAINFLAWIVLAIVMKRARQIWLAILFTIVVAIPAYLVAMNTMGIVESFTAVTANASPICSYTPSIMIPSNNLLKSSALYTLSGTPFSITALKNPLVIAI